MGAFDDLYSTILGAKGSAKGSDSLRFKGALVYCSTHTRVICWNMCRVKSPASNRKKTSP